MPLVDGAASCGLCQDPGSEAHTGSALLRASVSPSVKCLVSGPSAQLPEWGVERGLRNPCANFSQPPLLSWLP